MNVIHFNTITSTNDYARENVLSLPMPSLIIADEQTAGRGRRGKSFYSPDKTGVYFSLIFKADDHFDLITPAAALCVCNSLKKFTGIDTDIKWVNDIYLAGKKTAGILTERFAVNDVLFTVIGIGINFTTESFPDELTLAGSVGVMPDKNKFAIDVAESIMRLNSDFDKDKILFEYKSKLFILGKEIEYVRNGEVHKAVAEDINSDCNLVCSDENGTVVLSSGEISLIMR